VALIALCHNFPDHQVNGGIVHIKASVSASVLAVAALVALPASRAVADTTAWLVPLSNFNQLVVDSAHDHLFIDGGGELLVTDFSGSTQAVFPAPVTEIALSPDGSTVYAASGDKVLAISTATLQQTAQYSIAGIGGVANVAVQSGKLWVSYVLPGAAMTGAIGDFDLSTASPEFETQPGMGTWATAPLLAADPSDTGVLVAMEADQDPTPVASYDVTKDPVVVRAQTTSLLTSAGDDCGVAYDLAVVPGGAQFIPACGGTSPQNVIRSEDLTRYSTADLSAQGTFGPVPDPDAVAIASGTGLVATATTPTYNDQYSAGPYVFAPGSQAPVNVMPGDPWPRGVGVTADGSEMFDITLVNSSWELQTYQDPSAGHWSLTMAPASSSVTLGGPVQLTGTLEAGGTIPPPGTPVTVTRTGPDGVKSLPASTVNNYGLTDGTFALTDTPSVSGSYTYIASYPGAAAGDVATASATVTVAPAPAATPTPTPTPTTPAPTTPTTHTPTTPPVPKLKPALTISATPATSVYEPTVRLTVHLGTKNGDRAVSVYAQPAGSRTRTLLTRADVNASGSLTLSYRAAHTTTFSAVFTGDTAYAPASASAAVQVSAAVSLRLGGYYASKRVGSVTYRLYDRTRKLAAAVSVSPAKNGECVKLEVQEYQRGTWHASTMTGCIALGKSSTAAGSLGLSRANLGYPYRVRADYRRGTDISNLNADSAWQYFTVGK
jgi:hypothetical protein